MSHNTVWWHKITAVRNVSTLTAFMISLHLWCLVPFNNLITPNKNNHHLCPSMHSIEAGQLLLHQTLLPYLLSLQMASVSYLTPPPNLTIIIHIQLPSHSPYLYSNHLWMLHFTQAPTSHTLPDTHNLITNGILKFRLMLLYAYDINDFFFFPFYFHSVIRLLPFVYKN